MCFFASIFYLKCSKKHIKCIGEVGKSVIQLRGKILPSFFLNPLVYVQLAILCKHPTASFRNPQTMPTSSERFIIAFYNHNALVLRVVIEYVCIVILGDDRFSITNSTVNTITITTTITINIYQIIFTSPTIMLTINATNFVN